MTTRESLPNAAALEQIEAPSREVADAKRRAAEAEASDKPGLKDAVETLARLDDPRVVGVPRTSTMLGVGDPKQQTRRAVKRDARDTNKLPALARGELHTSPSLARVLAGDDQRDGHALVEEHGDTFAEEPFEQRAATPSKTRVLVVVGAIVALLFGMLAIGMWGGGHAPTTTNPSSESTAPSMTTPTTKQTAPVTAIAIATAEPPATSAAVTADPVRSSGSARSSSKASAKSASAAVSTSKPASPTTSSAKPQGTNWVPEDS